MGRSVRFMLHEYADLRVSQEVKAHVHFTGNQAGSAAVFLCHSTRDADALYGQQNDRDSSQTPRLTYHREQTIQQAVSLRAITTPEEVEVVEDVVKVIECFTRSVTGIQWPAGMVGRIKVTAETPE